MSFETIRANDIHKYIGNNRIIIVDLRDLREYEAGHIPTAIHIPYEALEDVKESLDSNSIYIFYCDRGNVSLRACKDLMNMGYKLASMHGGFRAYRGRIERKG